MGCSWQMDWPSWGRAPVGKRTLLNNPSLSPKMKDEDSGLGNSCAVKTDCSRTDASVPGSTGCLRGQQDQVSPNCSRTSIRTGSSSSRHGLCFCLQVHVSGCFWRAGMLFASEDVEIDGGAAGSALSEALPLTLPSGLGFPHHRNIVSTNPAA